jgi:PmbA protein
MEQAYAYDSKRLALDLLNAESIGRLAAEKAVKRLNPRTLPTQKALVLFDPEAARGFWGHMVSAISGGRLYRKLSFLLDAQGTQIFPKWLTMTEDPFLIRASGSCPFDGEGVRVKPRVLIDNGVLTGYVLSSYSARRLALPNTGNSGGVHNLAIPGTLSFEQMLKTMDRGLLVTELMGNSVNMVTGDYSRGASGFWVEGGEIQFPVHEITLGGKLSELYQNIIAVGTDVDTRSNIRTGSVLVDGFLIGGGG